MARFVVLRHELPTTSSRRSHWDFMLETSGVLRTWALEDIPSPDKATHARSLPDHRADYLDYEGAVSDDRGRVWRWDAGVYQCLTDLADMCVVCLEGRQLRGTWTLSRTARDDQRWVVSVGRA